MLEPVWYYNRTFSDPVKMLDFIEETYDIISDIIIKERKKWK